MALQIPARSGPGARGKVRGKKEEVLAHLLVVLDRWEKVGKVLDGGGQGAAARFSGGFWARRSGLRAARGQGRARDGVSAGGASLEWRVDSELRARRRLGGAAAGFWGLWAGS